MPLMVPNSSLRVVSTQFRFISFCFAQTSLDFTRFRRHISTSVSELFECQRTQLVEVTVPTDSIVKTFDVVKHI